MKKFLFISLLSALCILAACKKDKETSTPNYYMKFKIDGVQKEFTSTGGFFYTPDSCSLVGLIREDEPGNFFSIDINTNDNTPIITGREYNETMSASAYVPNCYFSCAINSPNKFSYRSWSSTLPEPPLPVKVLITEIDTSFVKGSFSGQMRKVDSLDKIVNITEGSFFLHRP